IAAAQFDPLHKPCIRFTRILTDRGPLRLNGRFIVSWNGRQFRHPFAANLKSTVQLCLFETVATQTVSSELDDKPPINLAAIEWDEVIKLSDSFDHSNPTALIKIL